MAIPKKLVGFSVSVDGRGYLGLADIELPDLELNTEDHESGGLAVGVKVPVGGMAPMDTKLTMYGYEPAALKLFGVVSGRQTQITARGSLKGDEGETPVLVQMRGLFYQASLGGWKAKEGATMEGTINCRYYQLKIGGEVVIEIDAENMIRKIGGVDQLAETRANIGV